ncbi:hypothetical protein ACWCQ1_41200 [Streptomyces sp. NPDC002144]
MATSLSEMAAQTLQTYFALWEKTKPLLPDAPGTEEAKAFSPGSEFTDSDPNCPDGYQAAAQAANAAADACTDLGYDDAAHIYSSWSTTWMAAAQLCQTIG